MRTEVIRSRIDPAAKEQANIIIHNMGLTMSDAIRLFLYQVIAEQKIPFAIRQLNEETIAALRAAESGDVQPTTLDELMNEWK